MSSFPIGDIVENPQASPKFDLPNVSTLPDPPGDVENSFKTRCVTGVAFIKTIHGILNFVLILTLVLVLISAGVADGSDGSLADNSNNTLPTSVNVSAVHTRNSILVFTAFALLLVLLDTILHVTRFIRRFPPIFELGFVITMLILAAIFLILGCCAAAWEKKMRDKLPGILKRKGAAASASFWLFVTMIGLSINYGLRLTHRRLPKFGR